MNTYNIAEIKGADMQARFYVNGKRVSREKCENIKQQGYMFGTVNTFHTKAWQVGTKTRRTNYMTVTF